MRCVCSSQSIIQPGSVTLPLTQCNSKFVSLFVEYTVINQLGYMTEFQIMVYFEAFTHSLPVGAE